MPRKWFVFCVQVDVGGVEEREMCQMWIHAVIPESQASPTVLLKREPRKKENKQEISPNQPDYV